MLVALSVALCCCGPRAVSGPVGTEPAPPIVVLAPAGSTIAPASVGASTRSLLVPAPPKVWGAANLDPYDDGIVAPPDEVPECETRLRSLGAKFEWIPLRVHREPESGVRCGSFRAVSYDEGPEGFRYFPPAEVDCNVALALPRLERIAQEEAARHLHEPLLGLEHMGTYVCRPVRCTDRVSQHAYGNAIDVAAFVTRGLGTIDVERHFGPLPRTEEEAARGPETLSPEARFLRAVARRLYDEDVFSVVLTPFFDERHVNHFHLDMARYRVDGALRRVPAKVKPCLQ